MEPTIYTDGRDVKVTHNEFIAGKKSYKLEGIVNASINLIRASLVPPVFMLLLGIAVIASGLLHFYSSQRIDSLSVGYFIMTANRLAVLAGVLFLIIGIILSFKARDKYAVHIVTAEGHKEPVISKKRDYVAQIVKALQHALNWK
jgi:large-conductance mechanosensitive channel